MTTEIKNLRKKIRALQTEGTGMVLADFAQIIETTLYEQTGLKLKKDNVPLDYAALVLELIRLYQIQLDELLKEHDGPVYQRTIDDEIAERKTE